LIAHRLCQNLECLNKDEESEEQKRLKREGASITKMQ